MPHRRDGSDRPPFRRPVDSGMAELLLDADRPGAWMLLLDDVPQSHVDLDDPEYLDFDYMRRLGHVADLAAPPGQPLRVLHLGAGGLTLARYVAATRPGSSQLAVESDGALADLVRRRLPLSQRSRRPAGSRPAGSRPAGNLEGRDRAGGSPAGGSQAGRVRLRVGDARTVLEQMPAGSFDLVVADLFTGARTPAHLTS